MLSRLVHKEVGPILGAYRMGRTVFHQVSDCHMYDFRSGA